jgi:hypothetical protein
MKRHAFAHGVLAGVMGFLALTCGSPAAKADPEPIVPPGPSIVNEILQQTPGAAIDPRDRQGPQRSLGGKGMQCQNLWARCR